MVLAGLVEKTRQQGVRQPSTRPASRPRQPGSSSGSWPPASSIWSGPVTPARAPAPSTPGRNWPCRPSTARWSRCVTTRPRTARWSRRTPEIILGLKVCDPACGSASFLVAALHYLTDALYKSLCHHRKLDDPEQAKKLTLPYGRPRTDQDGRGTRAVPARRPAARRHLCRADQGPACGGMSWSAASTAWTSTRWPSNLPVCRCGWKRSTPNCRSRSSTTRSRSATRWSAAGWTGWRTIRSKHGSEKAATARTGNARSDRDIPQGGEEGRQAVGRWPDQAGDAGGYRKPVPEARPACSRMRQRHHRPGGGQRSQGIRDACTICPIHDPDEREQYYRRTRRRQSGRCNN